MTGYLATLTSSSEDAFVWNALSEPCNHWLGGYQVPGSPEPAGGWVWVTGEPWGYEHWRGGEPNNNCYGTTEDYLQYDWHCAPPEFGWNDYPARGCPGTGTSVSGFIVEFPDSPTPALGALGFDGDAHALVPHSNSLSFSADSSFTIELWFKPDGQRSAYHILGKRDDCSHELLNYQFHRGNVDLLSFLSDGDDISSGYDPPVNRWTHVAATYVPHLLRLYVNGQLVVSTPYTVVGQTDGPLLFGDSGGCPTSERFTGEMDEIRIWCLARTDQEIACYYNRTIDPTTPGLVGYWRFDEVGGQVIRDLSPYHHDGVLGSDSTVIGEDPARVASTAPIQPVQADARVASIVGPTGQTTYPAAIIPHVRIAEDGSTAAPITATLRIGGAYEASITETIEPGSTADLMFPQWQAPGLGSYPIECFTALAGDACTANDTLVATFSVVAGSADPIITRVAPSAGGYGASTTLRIEGANFLSGATTRLRMPGQPDIVGDAAQTRVVDAGHIEVPLNLVGAVPGARDVIVRNPGGAEGALLGGFDVEPAMTNVLTSILGRLEIRGGLESDYTFECINAGNTDADSLVMLIMLPASVSYRHELRLPNDTLGISATSFSAGVSDGATAILPVAFGILGAGSRASCPLHLTVSSEAPSVNLRTAVIDRPHAGRLQDQLWNSAVDMTLADTQVDSYRQAASLSPQQCRDQLNLLLRKYTGELFSDLGGAIANAPLIWFTITVFLVGVLGMELSAAVGLAIVLEGMWSLSVDVIPSLLKYAAQVAVATAALHTGVHHTLDPNDKIGTPGVTAAAYVRDGVDLPYRVYFENDSTATASVRTLLVSDSLNRDWVDLDTFELGEIVLGTRHVQVPPGLKAFDTDVDLRPQQDLLVRIGAAVDVLSGVATWGFTSIDPATGLPPDDPTIGFLPPDTSRPEGEGHVSFRVNAKTGVDSGTEIRNRAAVRFDANVTMLTPEWLNTVDDSKPQSGVTSAIPIANDSVLVMTWDGFDTGSGIRDYSMYVAEGEGQYVPWLTSTAAVQDTFRGRAGTAYKFYSLARDSAGNVEDPPETPDLVVSTTAGVGGARDEPRLNLEGLRPNPTPRGFIVAFSLPTRDEAAIEVLDIAGRCMLRRQVGFLGPGSHVINLQATGTLPPGVYLVRLKAASGSITRRAVVLGR